MRLPFFGKRKDVGMGAAGFSPELKKKMKAEFKAARAAEKMSRQAEKTARQAEQQLAFTNQAWLDKFLAWRAQSDLTSDPISTFAGPKQDRSVGKSGANRKRQTQGVAG